MTFEAWNIFHIRYKKCRQGLKTKHWRLNNITLTSPISAGIPNVDASRPIAVAARTKASIATGDCCGMKV